jgi:putative endonuclease
MKAPGVKWFRSKPRPLGELGEDLAAKHLRRQGFRILERNADLGRYEIDIIAQDGDTLVFVEVKSRRTADSVHPEDNVGHTKQQHIRSAAAWYLKQKGDPDTYVRFDVVSVHIPESGKPTCTLIRDAFPG